MYYQGRFDIYVPEEVEKILNNDAVLFEFYKADDRTVNKNGFLNALIKGYYDQFLDENNTMYDRLVSLMKEYAVDVGSMSGLAAHIRDGILFPEERMSKRNNKARISIKPSNATQQIIKAIPDTEMPDGSASKYFRRMLVSYCRKPLDERERIVFAEIYHLPCARLSAAAACSFHRFRKQDPRFPRAIRFG